MEDDRCHTEGCIRPRGHAGIHVDGQGRHLKAGSSSVLGPRTCECEHLELFQVISHGPGGFHALFTECPDVVQRLLQKGGLPPECRWEAWRIAVHVDESFQSGMYNELVRAESRWARQIQLDTSRMFIGSCALLPDHQERLARLLRAYATLRPNIGYCQGMNFVAEVLHQVSQDEEDAFWVFVRIMDACGLAGFFREGFPLLRKYLRACCSLGAEILPELWAHFKRESFRPAVHLQPWFLTLFAQSLPMSMVLEFWDTILCQGLCSLVPISVALLEFQQDVLMSEDCEGLIRCFKSIALVGAAEDVADPGIVARAVLARSNDLQPLPPCILASLTDTEG